MQLEKNRSQAISNNTIAVLPRDAQSPLAHLPAGLAPVLLRTLQQEESAAYHIAGKGEVYWASNPAAAMEIIFTTEGVSVHSQWHHADEWVWQMGLRGVGSESTLHPVADPVFYVDGNRIEYRRGELTEWYLNGSLGLEQSFTLHQPLHDTSDSLVIDLALSGDVAPSIDATGDLILRGSAGQCLRFGHLYADDATGRPLATAFRVVSGHADTLPHVQIVVDVTDAEYPITIDPLLTSQTTLSVPGLASNDNFGYSVAISGTTAFVGAPNKNLDGFAGQGAVYVFKQVIDNTTNPPTISWQLVQTVKSTAPAVNDHFGAAIALDPENAAIASKNAAGNVVVQIRVRNATDPTLWTLQQTLTLPSGSTSDGFGTSLALGDNTLAIGTPIMDGNNGRVYVYTRSGVSWSLQQELIPADAPALARFGAALDLDSDTLFVGAPDRNLKRGSVYLFTRKNTIWTQNARLEPGSPITPNVNDSFGAALSLYDDTLAVGAPQLPSNAGFVTLFKRIDNVWTQQVQLSPEGNLAYSKFGSALTLWQDKLLVGAPGQGNSTWPGSVQLFARNNDVWTFQEKVSITGANDSDLGNAVAYDGQLILAGNTTRTGGRGEVMVYPLLATTPTNLAQPEDGLNWAGQTYYQNSLNLRSGDKTFEATDLSIDSPVGSLAFKRVYHLNRRNDKSAFLGLAWAHNFAVAFQEEYVAPNRFRKVRLPNGGQLVLIETPPNSFSYVGEPGSDARMGEVPNGTSEEYYELITGDRVKYVFDQQKRLRKQVWPNGEKWTCTYDSNGKLVSVLDDYGRGLTFAYRPSGSFDANQLWRVGDHNTQYLGGGGPPLPQGRFIEFTYTPQKNNGITVTSPQPLLWQISDVLGQSWEYRYYGQQTSESAADKLDNLLEVISPSVGSYRDTGVTGTSAPISIEKTKYLTDGNGRILRTVQVRGNGLLKNRLEYHVENRASTKETQLVPDANLDAEVDLIPDKRIMHRFTNGVPALVQDELGNRVSQTVTDSFRVEAVTDPNGNKAKFEWSSDGKNLNKVTDPVNAISIFTYNLSYPTTDVRYGTVDTGTDAQGHFLKFSYDAVLRSPTEIRTYRNAQHFSTSPNTPLRIQKYGYDVKGRVISEGLAIVPDYVMQRETRYAYYNTDASGRSNGLLQTVTQVDVLNAANNMVTTHFYDSAGRLVKKTENTTFGRCRETYTVYDDSNRVVASICNYEPGTGVPDPNTKAAAVALFNESNPTKNKVTTYSYDSLGRQITMTVDAGASYAQTTITGYDALNRVIRTITNYKPNTATIPDPIEHDRNAFAHGINNDQNLVVDTFYNKRGLVKKKIDVLGNVTLNGYDDSGRLIKVVENVSPANLNYNNDYAGGMPTLENYSTSSIPGLDLVTTYAYDASGNQAKIVDPAGQITFQVFDKLNRIVKAVKNAKSPATVALAMGEPGYNANNDPRSNLYQVTGAQALTVEPSPESQLDTYEASGDSAFDSIERVIYDSIGNIRRSRDAAGNWTLFGYDELGRNVKTIRFASTPTYDTGDIALANYPAIASSDKDLISVTAYDTAERVLYTGDALGRQTWTGYDGLGRVIKSIVNIASPGTAQPNGSSSDPRSASYVPSSAADLDRITLTEYDANRRMTRTRDAFGNWTLYGYDEADRQVKVIRNAKQPAYNLAVDPSLTSYVPDSGAVGDNLDFDVITMTIYDAKGRVSQSRDALTRATLYVYDELDRAISTTLNYDGTGTVTPDRNVTSFTAYDLVGRVILTTDARDMRTRFEYNPAGQRNRITQAEGTALATTTYTCYDKAGRVLRTIQNYIPRTEDPDSRTSGGSWEFNPATHGVNEDQNLISTNLLDNAGRVISSSDPLGNTVAMVYAKDGLLLKSVDALGAITQYRYDGARRRSLMVRNYVAGALADPVLWIWSSTNNRWEDGTGVLIPFGTANDQNITAQTTYDKAGRVISERDPRGKLSQYQYDALDRRTWYTDPRNSQWQTSYTASNELQSTLTDPNAQQTEQSLDKLGRLKSIRYLAESPKLTPDVFFAYDKHGNRLNMVEKDGATVIRTTAFTYDAIHRTTAVNLNDGSNPPYPQTVSYQYDATGRKTQMQLPGPNNPTVSYGYNKRGELISLTDWLAQTTRYTYDGAMRLTSSQQATGLSSTYQRDASGRLRKLSHKNGMRTLADFQYAVDARGNRTQVLETVAKTGTGGIIYASEDFALETPLGTWTDVYPFKVSSSLSATLRLVFAGAGQATLRMGTGPDHSIYDVYVNGDLWQSVNGYAAAAGEAALTFTLRDDGPHTLEIRNRPEKDTRATGTWIRFKSLATATTAGQFDVRLAKYSYDGLARLQLSNVYAGQNVTGTPLRRDAYTYDMAGNRTRQQVTVLDVVTVTDYTYDAANRLATSQATGGPVVNYSYDANGNLQGDGVTTYAWDRANRLRSAGGATYTYDGLGRRISQATGGVTTTYLNDVLSSIWKVVQQVRGGERNTYLHGPTGVQMENGLGGGVVRYPLSDALGSVRSVLDGSLNVLESRVYTPYGEVSQTSGTSQSVFGYTGEQTDVESNFVYLRMRHLNPMLGQFTSLDLLETVNRYHYVGCNPLNWVDPLGLFPVPEDYEETFPVLRSMQGKRPHKPVYTPIGKIAVTLPSPPPNPTQAISSWPGLARYCAKVGARACNAMKDAIGLNVPQSHLYDVEARFDASIPERITARNRLNLPALSRNMSRTFGYKIEFTYENASSKFDGSQTTIINLLDADLHIVSYLEGLQANSGLALFRMYYAQNKSGVPLRILIGNSSKTDFCDAPGACGYTPQGQNFMALGNSVPVTTIVHEFGHQVDSYFDGHYMSDKSIGGDKSFPAYLSK